MRKKLTNHEQLIKLLEQRHYSTIEYLSEQTGFAKGTIRNFFSTFDIDSVAIKLSSCKRPVTGYKIIKE